MHLIGWYESVDTAGALTDHAALSDTSMTLEGTDGYQVPAGASQLFAGMALGGNLTRARFVAPSLEQKRFTCDLFPVADAADALALTHPQVWMPKRAVDLAPGEVLKFQAAEDNGGGADGQYGLAFLKGPGELPAMPPGPIIQARATGAATLTANAWTAVSPTLEQELPAGRYACVGLIASGASLIAARLVIPGQAYRPGVPGLAGAESAARNADIRAIEPLMYYNMGEFSNTAIPQVECLASAGDTAQVFYFLLVKVA